MSLRFSDSDLRRFWSKVELPSPDGCMLWMATRYASGYGGFKAGGSMFRAHRVSLWLAEGPPPTDQHQAAHSCRDRHCVAPAHLRWATSTENQADRVPDGTTIRGERNGRAKLTWEQVTEIRARFADGAQRQQLAREYGVDWKQINRITRGEHWPTGEAS